MSDSFPQKIKKENNNLNYKVTLICSEFNSDIVNKLTEATERRLSEICKANISKISVPGAYEIPFVVKKLISAKNVDAIICLGAIIRGDTSHYDLISENVFKSISSFNNLGEIPIINGILTTENKSQANARISNGAYFADSCLHMIKLNKDLA